MTPASPRSSRSAGSRGVAAGGGGDCRKTGAGGGGGAETGEAGLCGAAGPGVAKGWGCDKSMLTSYREWPAQAAPTPPSMSAAMTAMVDGRQIPTNPPLRPGFSFPGSDRDLRPNQNPLLSGKIQTMT